VTTLIDLQPPAPSPQPDDDNPRQIRKSLGLSDRVFRSGDRAIAAVVLVITSAIGIFLGYQLVPTLREYGWRFFTENEIVPSQNLLGIAAGLAGTIEVAIIALAISFPLALLTALFISEIAPPWLRGVLSSAVDLMAAIPSIVYGLWGLLLIAPHALYFSRWLNEYLGWIPIFHVDGGDPHAPAFDLASYTQSPFIAGLVVSMMVLPIGCAVMTGVFRQAPVGEREAAYALGSTRWAMIRAVVIPFGRGGIIGGTMLALGRALGETIAVLLILTENFDIRLRPLQEGGVTISQLIANFFGDSSGAQLSALLAAGFVLFVLTLIVNTIAAMIVSRSRSGAQTEI
jgi:phosphate transport system permease protein